MVLIQELDKSSVVILGGTGPVGVASAVICAKAGANVRLVGRSIEKAEKLRQFVMTDINLKMLLRVQMQISKIILIKLTLF